MKGSMAASKYLRSFKPGFYFDGSTVYVDIAEFIRAHNIVDGPELRDVIWSESQSVFSGIPIERLESGARFTATKEEANAPLRAALSSPDLGD